MLRERERERERERRRERDSDNSIYLENPVNHDIRYIFTSRIVVCQFRSTAISQSHIRFMLSNRQDDNRSHVIRESSSVVRSFNILYEHCGVKPRFDERRITGVET